MVFVRTAEGTHSTPGRVSCTTSETAPTIDAALGAASLFFAGAALATSGEGSGGASDSQHAIAFGSAILALIAGTSAVYGYLNVSECRELRARPAEQPLAPRAAATASDRPQAGWRGDFETGDLSQWSYLLNPRGLSVVSSPVAEGRHAARVDINARDLWQNGLNRVELQYKPPPATLAEGRRSCFAWRFLLPSALSDARHQIGYWESYPSYKQIMSFEVRGQDIRFLTRMPAERVHWTAPGVVTPAVWHQIAVCAIWSTDPAVGAVDVWFDGAPVVARGAARTLWDNPNFVQIGILRDAPAAPEVMLIDDAFEAADFAPAPRP